MSSHDPALEREFDAVTRAIGLEVPAEWRNGMIATYADTKKMTALLRQPRSAAAEPSNTYSLVPFRRKD
jgi:hypothetical protein